MLIRKAYRTDMLLLFFAHGVNDELMERIVFAFLLGEENLGVGLTDSRVPTDLLASKNKKTK